MNLIISYPLLLTFINQALNMVVAGKTFLTFHFRTNTVLFFDDDISLPIYTRKIMPIYVEVGDRIGSYHGSVRIFCCLTVITLTRTKRNF